MNATAATHRAAPAMTALGGGSDRGKREILCTLATRSDSAASMTSPNAVLWK
jgi:hypothetical protein